MAICRCSPAIKPRITSPSTAADFIRSPASVIVSRSLMLITSLRAAAVAVIFRPKKKSNAATSSARLIATSSDSSLRKSVNDSPMAPPIRMFGGSPISVAVPPMFEEKISIKRNGYGFNFSLRVISIVTGTISSTVVTLSRNADSTAVTTPSTARMPRGFAFTSFADLTAAYWNAPDFSIIPTIIIMPISSAMVLKSMPFSA